jgi:SHS2 domain-containing protein
LKRFEEIEHTADWAFRAFGRDLKELFENAAFALFSLEGVSGNPSTVTRRVIVQGIDLESLLVNWLSELLFLQETCGETYSRFTVEDLTPAVLSATIQGSPSGPLNKFVKAVTYHDLHIEQAAEGWQATVVVDV